MLIMVASPFSEQIIAQKDPIQKDTVSPLELTPSERIELERIRKEAAKKEAAEADKKARDAEKAAKKAKKDATDAVAREKKAKEEAKAAEKKEKEKEKERQKKEADKLKTKSAASAPKPKAVKSPRDDYWKKRSSDSLKVVNNREKEIREAQEKANKKAAAEKFKAAENLTAASKGKGAPAERHDPKYWKKRTDDSLATVKAAAAKAKKAAEKAEKKRLKELKNVQKKADAANKTKATPPKDSSKPNKTSAPTKKAVAEKHDLKYWKQHAVDSANQVKKQADLARKKKEKEDRRIASEAKRKADADKKAAVDAKDPKKIKVAKGKQDKTSGLVTFTPDGQPIVPMPPPTPDPKTVTSPVVTSNTPSSNKTTSPDVWQDPNPNRWKTKNTSFSPNGAVDCDWDYTETDEFTGIQRKGLKEQLFFGFTDEKYKSSFPTGDYLTCQAYFSLEGKQKFLNLTYIIDAPSARNEFGYVEVNGALQIKLINGEVLQLASAEMDKGKVYQNRTYYRLRYELNSSSIKELSTWEIDSVRMSWSVGYEDYEVFDVDCLRRQINCIK